MGRSGVWAETATLPPVAVFELTRRFNTDPIDKSKKLNLGVGAYRDEQERPYVFSSVTKAERLLLEAGNNKEYLPVTGLPAFTAAAARLLFGGDSDLIGSGRLVTCQTLSGTGALTVAAHLIKRTLAGRRIFASNPTWENHGKVVADAFNGSVALEYYRYYDVLSRGLDAAGMLEDLHTMPRGSIVLLHACAHNPTGVDPTHEQWDAIANVMRERDLLPWFDTAYQGFATGLPDVDAWAVRRFASLGFEMLVCQSFAKNFGLYCERVGALHVVACDAPSAAAALSQLEGLIRPMYSTPPAHGARIVATILGNAELTAEWRGELLCAMQRIARMRELLHAALVARGTPGSWSHVVQQIGMFSFTGLTEAQSVRMTDEFHVYMLRNGRISVAGLTEAKIALAADAMHAVVTDTKAEA